MRPANRLVASGRRRKSTLGDVLIAQKSRITLAHIVELQGDQAFVRRHRLGRQPIVGPSVHPARFLRKRLKEIGAPTKAHPELLRSADGAIPRDFLLAHTRQASALAAREDLAP